ncbi:MAG TPA: response regulator [Flavisolibacter sp.]|nr:response regulator [Flavisolibacter sp.]
MKSINCIITDDEPLARQGLEGYIRQVPFLSLVDLCENCEQLEEALQKKPVDLIFLDIEMPYRSGIELLQSLAHPPKVIITTAYESYALQGYELDVVDYLLKPISFDRFQKAMKKVYTHFQERIESKTDHFFIKADGAMIKINFEEIYCIEGLQNYVCIYTREKSWVTHTTLKHLLETLPQEFIQVHKSYIINEQYISMLTGRFLQCGPFKMPVYKKWKAAVKQRLSVSNNCK